MAHYTGHITQGGVEALRAIIGSGPVWKLFAPQVSAGFGNAPHEVHELVFWIGRHDFVVFGTDWVTTRCWFNYHTYIIERGSVPGRIPYFPEGSPERKQREPGPPQLGLTSSLEVRLGDVERIEIFEACCTTTVPEADDPETVDYDYALRFFGTQGGILLTTSFDSILGAIEIRKDAVPVLNEDVDTFRTRLVLD